MIIIQFACGKTKMKNLNILMFFNNSLCARCRFSYNVQVKYPLVLAGCEPISTIFT